MMLAMQAPIMVLTGGPGCGKTFATEAIVHFWKDKQKKLALCAPTGEPAAFCHCFSLHLCPCNASCIPRNILTFLPS